MLAVYPFFSNRYFATLYIPIKNMKARADEATELHARREEILLLDVFRLHNSGDMNNIVKNTSMTAANKSIFALNA
jgi:hypothetical protein